MTACNNSNLIGRKKGVWDASSPNQAADYLNSLLQHIDNLEHQILDADILYLRKPNSEPCDLAAFEQQERMKLAESIKMQGSLVEKAKIAMNT